MSNDTKALVERLRIRASIRRRITTRKSVQEGKPDRIADLLEEAATALASLDESTVRVPREPAAWRWRYSPEHQWHYVEQEHQRSAQAYDWEPVYAAAGKDR